jgi:DNA (cytosine-5)-methyltransferase 1
VFIDLFAGCGGLSLGLLRAGWKGLFALEKDPFAFETLKTNLIEGVHGPTYSWPAWVPKEPSEVGCFIEEHRDEIKQLSGKVDLIAGGPPCQGFSLAGRRKRDDRRNRAIKHYFEFIRLVRPAVLLIENVRGIAVEFGKKRRASENKNRVGRPAKPFSVRIQKELEDSGYRVYSDIIRAMDFGVPQFRPRFIMIGIHEDHLKGSVLADPFELLTTRRNDFLSAKGLPKVSVTVADAISDLEISGKELIDSDDSLKFKQATYSGPHTTYQRLMRDGFEGTPNSMRLARHTPETTARFEKILDTCRKGVQLNRKDRSDFGLNKHCTVPLDPQKPCHTLTTLPDDILHYSEPRILTVREYARLQSFPDWYEFKGKYNTGGYLRVLECPRYTQIGNAVAPLVAECVGLLLKDIRSGESAADPQSRSVEDSPESRVCEPQVVSCLAPLTAAVTAREVSRSYLRKARMAKA